MNASSFKGNKVNNKVAHLPEQNILKLSQNTNKEMMHLPDE